jgi:broad-specificity NMP kinase
MKPVIVAGLPGVGKSRFSPWLLSKGWSVLEGDVAYTWDRDVHDGWDAALAGSDSALES